MRIQIGRGPTLPITLTPIVFQLQIDGDAARKRLTRLCPDAGVIVEFGRGDWSQNLAHGTKIARIAGHVQRRIAVSIGDHGAGAEYQQTPHDLGLPGPHGQMQRRLRVIVLDVQPPWHRGQSYQRRNYTFNLMNNGDVQLTALA